MSDFILNFEAKVLIAFKSWRGILLLTCLLVRAPASVYFMTIVTVELLRLDSGNLVYNDIIRK